MRYKLSQFVIIAVSGFALSCIMGCSSLRPIASTPPIPAIVLTNQFKAYIPLKNVAFPPGEYRPLYEDKGGYYYQAPSKVVESGLMFHNFCDGGLYVRRGMIEATKWYIIQQNGGTIFGRVNPVELQKSVKR